MNKTLFQFSFFLISVFDKLLNTGYWLILSSVEHGISLALILIDFHTKNQ